MGWCRDDYGMDCISETAAHAVPCISETAEKNVKYTVSVGVTPWMEPKGAKSEPKGAKRERKCAKIETKSIKNLSKWIPKPTRAPRSILDGQNGTKTDLKWKQKGIPNLCKIISKIDAKINAEKVSENEAKMNQN